MSDPLRCVDVHRPHLGEVDDEAVVQHAVAGGIVTTPAHRDLQLVLPSKGESSCNVGGADAARDHRRPAIDERVETPAGGVVLRIRRCDHSAGKRPSQLAQALVEPAHFTTRYLRWVTPEDPMTLVDLQRWPGAELVKQANAVPKQQRGDVNLQLVDQARPSGTAERRLHRRPRKCSCRRRRREPA